MIIDSAAAVLCGSVPDYPCAAAYVDGSCIIYACAVKSGVFADSAAGKIQSTFVINAAAFIRRSVAGYPSALHIQSSLVTDAAAVRIVAAYNTAVTACRIGQSQCRAAFYQDNIAVLLLFFKIT